jgi:hypothetical protein
MVSLSVLVSLAFIPFTFSQSTNNSDVGLQIAAIQAHFSNAGIVPSLLTTFSPSAVMSVAFNGVGDVAPGTLLTEAQVKPAPNLSLTPANSSVNFDGKYTLAMVDAGPVGFDESQGQTRHMLINGVTVAGTNVSMNSGLPVTAYAGPAPPTGTGPHRYVILLYSQPDSFSPPANLSQANTAVSVFNFPDYIKASNMGPLVAANYFTVEEGTATSSISPTSAVVSSTLSVAASGTTSASSAQVTNKSSDALTTKVSLALVLAAPVLAFFF